MASYQKVVSMLGNNLASFLQISHKFLVDWKIDVEKLLHFLQNIRKNDLVGLLSGTHEIKEKILKEEIFTSDYHKLTKFWKEEFNHDIPWGSLNFPQKTTSFSVMEYNPYCFTEDDVLNAYAKKFGKDTVYKYYDNIRNSIKTQQIHSTKAELFLHRGGQEPDKEHLGKSYDDFCNDGKQYINPLEGLIIAFRYRVETGKMMDVKSLTRFHALDSDGDAMDMCRNGNGKFFVNRNNRDYRNSDFGPRERVS